MADKESKPERHDHVDTIELPKPTHWPIVLALGVTLAVMGLVTSYGLTYLGIVLMIAGCIGWFFDMFPHPQHEHVPVRHQVIEHRSTRLSVDRIQPRGHTEWSAVQLHPLIVGVKAGIAGGIAMMIFAILYGVIEFHSIWYVPNLLGGAGLTGWAQPTLEQLVHFRPTAFFYAIVIDGVVSILVGVLYSALLPILPRLPILLGGVVAPVIWSLLLSQGLYSINPYLAEHTNWAWFLVSQVAFGLVASFMVARKMKYPGGHIPTLAVRFGVHTPWLKESGDGKGE